MLYQLDDAGIKLLTVWLRLTNLSTAEVGHHQKGGLCHQLLSEQAQSIPTRFRVHHVHGPQTPAEMINTQIQWWIVLIAEFSATVKYCQSTNNIWADMLSCMKLDDNKIALLEAEEQ